MIDGRLHPCGIFHGGHRGLLYGLIRPVVARLVGETGKLCGDRGGCRFTRVRRSHFHPCGQIRDLLRRKLFTLRRHLKVRIKKRNGLHEETVVSISRYDRRTKLTTLCCSCLAIQTQTAFLLFRTMAGDAFCFEQRSDVPGEILARLICPRRRISSE